MKIGILLSGSGVYDGSEIQESVLAMLALKENGLDYQCYSISETQHHVINHITGQEMDETRNILIESGRIARGDVKELDSDSFKEIDGLVIPGGFGAAKNFTDWAFQGPTGSINSKIKSFIQQIHEAKKPILALCVSPVVVAKALQGNQIALTLGTDRAASEYDIKGFGEGVESLGMRHQMATIEEVVTDHSNLVVTAPCYMMDVDILSVYKSVRLGVSEFKALLYR